MKCGLDIGSTLIKAAVYDEKVGNHVFASTKSITKDQLVIRLQGLGVTEVALTGVGQYDLPFPVKVERAANPIQWEIELQAKGARKLMEWEGILTANFGMVSIGTGTSYSHVIGDNVVPMAMGNFIGGGFLLGMSAQLPGLELCLDNERRLGLVDELTRRVMGTENPADLLIKDMIPATKGTPQGEFLIASCSKLNSNSEREEVCFGLVNCVAATVMRDVMMYRMSGQLPVDSITVVGSTVVSVPALGMMLENYGKLVGLKVNVPPHADFAGAVGALTQIGI